MDFEDRWPLRGAMDNERDLIARLFAMLTARFEDGAEIAAGGQNGRDAQQLAQSLRGDADEIATIADCIIAL